MIWTITTCIGVCTHTNSKATRKLDYQDWWFMADEQRIRKTQLGGSFAISLLTINLVLALLLFLAILVLHTHLIKYLPKRTDSTLQQIEKFFPVALVPLQIFSVILWAALYGYYDYPNDGVNDPQAIIPGAALILVIVAILVDNAMTLWHIYHPLPSTAASTTAYATV
mmetsp:Transcript_25322/g.35491  ORF Transcript_25322/g.35491 Transcript_25322/m.35491 type:complete len:168 (-) Transcript_25322:22-525(-)